MLSDQAFEQWCLRLGLSEQAKAVITQIRTSPPARHVQSAAGNVSGTYPSVKMGCAIQFESHRDELPFVYLIDHDLQVVEFYDRGGDFPDAPNLSPDVHRLSLSAEDRAALVEFLKALSDDRVRSISATISLTRSRFCRV